jgi:hypothetical protein
VEDLPYTPSPTGQPAAHTRAHAAHVLRNARVFL